MTARASSTPAHAEPTLVWCDDFDGPSGAPADPAFWVPEVGDGTAQGIPGWGNGELQHYTGGTENAALDGRGNLVVTARRGADSDDGRAAYTSARLTTKGTFETAYGRIEARIRVPRGVGLWPAFWALGADIGEIGWPACGEIDVMEHVGRERRRVYGALHGPGYSGADGVVRTLDLAAPVSDDFHVFAVDWLPGSIAWSVDGVVFHRATPRDVAPSAWPFEHPFYLLLNVAIGGAFGGDVVDDSAFPARMLVDYVRVYAAA